MGPTMTTTIALPLERQGCDSIWKQILTKGGKAIIPKSCGRSAVASITLAEWNAWGGKETTRMNLCAHCLKRTQENDDAAKTWMQDNDIDGLLFKERLLDAMRL